MHIKDPAIPFDSIVVVIGANGFIGLETCEKLLEAGYKVRGTVRDVGKHSKWMHELFDGKWPGKFELVQVSDFEENGAFDEAFHGATGVIYVSTPIIFNSDPSMVIDPNIRSTINSMEAARKAGVHRYVLHSSSKAVETTIYDNRPHSVTTAMYNWESIRRTCCEPRKDTFDWMLNVYSAGRTLAELSFWSWVEENKPPFVVNSVSPDGNFGRGLVGATSTNALLKKILAGEWNEAPMPLVDVEDTARLLVAATAKSSIANERILAYYKRSSWNELRQVARMIRPDLVRGDDQDVTTEYLADASIASQRAEVILQEVGQPGFTAEEAMLQKFIATCY
ncbi:hypothetical protein S7711_10052 [Stachybotrys chartarum IBT 7711]|uniref:NAD-dependent epimerase/dehydratase domain-containing protein n=1 Tax=Stachybotrys chartarum (strain CBS 109288 / IBT 7711) TaxID=1280523 RepID=A0A084AZS5_STACB|nr:hypothetical protein S7711_10052 [Stachybotrys chartarum IBT 7711]KFA51960.1 hypothetical protein S40293_09487 [Stachybotrys chartarum IBT 40293]